MKRYGIPYQGSKNAIAEKVVNALPFAPVLYDIFAGGCAITHAAIESGKFGRVIANDITDAPQLFADAVAGKFKDEKRWISREDFFSLKDRDRYVRLCWSFGNNQNDYLYSKEIEPWKKALHYARVYNDYSLLSKFGINSDGSRKDIKRNAEEYKLKYAAWYIRNILKRNEADVKAALKNVNVNLKEKSEELREYLCDALKKDGVTQAQVCDKLGNFMPRHYFSRSQWQFPTRENYEKIQSFMPSLTKSYDEVAPVYLQRLQSLQSLQSLQRLQRLQSLQRLQRLKRLKFTQTDYRNLTFKDGAVIYADPPYKKTKGYVQDFDNESFYDWCRAQKNLVIISEYAMPDDFECVNFFEHISRFSATKNAKCTERLFVHKSQHDRYLQACGRLF